jgi:hypothetical protein
MDSETNVQTNSILIAELELSTDGEDKRANGYWLHINHRGSASGQEVGPFETRRQALKWLQKTYGG